ncbi:unnamed protein product, partial [Rotaria sp. Silwood1]
MSSLVIPLVLGIFTVVITVYQLREAKIERREDRNESRNQRRQEENHQRQLATARYRDELLVAYITDMATLLQRNKGSLTSNEVTAIVARVKTLTVLRQLDAQRKTQIILFLYEAHQLTETRAHRPLDLSKAKLLDMDFRDLALNEKQLDSLSLTGVFISNATFIDVEMKH